MNALLVRIKFCGITQEETLSQAASLGVHYVGFVFCPLSVRNLSIDQALALALATPAGLCKVGLFVDPAPGFVKEISERVPLDMIQLHGQETPEQALAIRAATGLPLMKAVGLSLPEDVQQISLWEKFADQILCDAKAVTVKSAVGGQGIAFNWDLIAGRRWSKPWMLAGGLTSENVREAVAVTQAFQVDVSSGIESFRGIKDSEKMHRFCCSLGYAPINLIESKDRDSDRDR